MIHAMLIVWAALASIVVLVAGLVLAFWRFGALVPGLLLSALATALLVATVYLASEEWGWRRRRRTARQVPAARHRSHHQTARNTTRSAAHHARNKARRSAAVRTDS